MSSTLANLGSMSTQVKPISLRVKPLAAPTRGVMLCDYRVGGYTLRAGQRVYVMNNACNESDIGSSWATHIRYRPNVLIDEDRVDNIEHQRESGNSAFASSSLLPSSNSYAWHSGLDYDYFPLARPSRSTMWAVSVSGMKKSMLVPAVNVMIDEQNQEAVQTISE